MSRVIIDGYNLLGASTGRGLAVDIEAERRGLLERLVLYRRQKRGVKLTVVFDAKAGTSLSRRRESFNGVEVIFAGSGEDADRVIKELARKLGSGVVVVSSDREIRDFVERCGGVSISSGEFVERLELAEYAALKGIEEDEEEHYREYTKKKGPSRRLPKDRRRRRGVLRKL